MSGTPGAVSGYGEIRLTVVRDPTSTHDDSGTQEAREFLMGLGVAMLVSLPLDAGIAYLVWLLT